MKPPKIQPIWMNGIGLVIAPLACSLNITLVAFFTHDIEGDQVLPTFFMAIFAAVLVCFPLGLLSEHVIQLWNSGWVKKSRWISAFYGGSALAFFVLFAKEGGYHVIAFIALLIPCFWSLLLILFAVFARSPKN